MKMGSTQITSLHIPGKYSSRSNAQSSVSAESFHMRRLTIAFYNMKDYSHVEILINVMSD